MYPAWHAMGMRDFFPAVMSTSQKMVLLRLAAGFSDAVMFATNPGTAADAVENGRVLGRIHEVVTANNADMHTLPARAGAGGVCTDSARCVDVKYMRVPGRHVIAVKIAMGGARESDPIIRAEFTLNAFEGGSGRRPAYVLHSGALGISGVLGGALEWSWPFLTAAEWVADADDMLITSYAYKEFGPASMRHEVAFDVTRGVMSVWAPRESRMRMLSSTGGTVCGMTGVPRLFAAFSHPVFNADNIRVLVPACAAWPGALPYLRTATELGTYPDTAQFVYGADELLTVRYTRLTVNEEKIMDFVLDLRGANNVLLAYFVCVISLTDDSERRTVWHANPRPDIRADFYDRAVPLLDTFHQKVVTGTGDTPKKKKKMQTRAVAARAAELRECAREVPPAHTLAPYVEHSGGDCGVFGDGGDGCVYVPWVGQFL